MTTKRAKKKTYRVVGRTSIRKSEDPESEDFEVWVNFEIGTTARSWPAHTPVEEWVASGHWVDPDAPKEPDEPKEPEA